MSGTGALVYVELEALNVGTTEVGFDSERAQAIAIDGRRILPQFAVPLRLQIAK